MSITDELRKWAKEHYDAQADAYSDGANYVFSNPTLFGLMRLPKDADGRVINIGDVMYDSNENPSEKFNVAIMELNKWGWSLIDSYGERNEPSQCCHYHEPTVEDVLREFGEKYCDMVDGCAEESELFAEYAAKLQLRSDGE